MKDLGSLQIILQLIWLMSLFCRHATCAYCSSSLHESLIWPAVSLMHIQVSFWMMLVKKNMYGNRPECTVHVCRLQLVTSKKCFSQETVVGTLFFWCHLLLSLNTYWLANMKPLQWTGPTHFLSFLSLKHVRWWGKTIPVQDLEQQLITFVLDAMPSFFTETAVHTAKAKGRWVYNEKLRDFRTECKQSCRQWKGSSFVDDTDIVLHIINGPA